MHNIKFTFNFSLNTWTHYAFVRKDTVLYMYSNGQLVDTNTIHTKTINECPLTVGVQMYDETLPYDGTRPGGGIQYPDHFKGYLQDIRISSKAVYTGCFVPPSKLHPNLLNTPLNPNCAEVLLHVQSNTTNVSDAVVDSSRNQYEFTKRGNATQHQLGKTRFVVWWFDVTNKIYNMFVTSKNETTKSPIHQFTNL